MNDETTKPRRADVFPPDYEFETPKTDEDYDDPEDSGPGCMAWGIMGLFGLVIAIAIVLTAILAGFNNGLSTAHVTAAASTQQNIARQCTIIPDDIAQGRFAVLEARFESMTIDGVLADCAAVFAPQATIIYEQSLITPTQPPTAIPTMTATSAPQIVEVTTIATIAPVVSNSGYDLDALLVEARDFMATSEYGEAVITLDAIRSIDPNFETQTINGLLFNALTNQALFLYRSDNGSLAEAILLTNRAEQFGDIQATELPFERSVAELYLDAQANMGLNYQLAISLFSQVVALSPNYPRGTGTASARLLEQYEAYGDAQLLGGESCQAENTFNTALSLSPNSLSLGAKATTANEQCRFGFLATIDPNATPDPDATVAPIGQNGS